MELSHVALLLGAGLAAGTVNAVAGGGSLVTFPALVAVGLPPKTANYTNSVAVSPGYLASVYGSRHDLPPNGRWSTVPVTVAGTLAGALLLRLTPAATFELIVPFLVIGAALVLAFQEPLKTVHSGRGPALGPDQQGGVRQHRSLTMHLIVGLGAVYGGYFGAALGVMLVAGLGLVLDETLRRINARKNLISAVCGTTTVVIFTLIGTVDWVAVAIVAPATLVGGYVGARVARRLPAPVLRAVIVSFGLLVGGYLLWRALR
jgi:uncharacterized protein